eukprot:TCALIF_13742-PA protein Name:"Protein of unknown function" AED:0.24 eAED:0.24 QI:1/0.25/0.6/0.6/0.5/0.6/5/229/188
MLQHYPLLFLCVFIGFGAVSSDSSTSSESESDREAKLCKYYNQSNCLSSKLSVYVDSTASCNDLVFQLGGTGRGTGIGQRQWSIKASECCGYGKGMGKNFDCLIVPGALDPLMMSKQGKFDQFCGRSAGLVGTTSTAAVMMSQTICSDRQPFNIRFLSDGFEADMEIGAGVMPGFKLTYFQTSNGCNA